MRYKSWFVAPLLATILVAAACSTESANPLEPQAPSFGVAKAPKAKLMSCKPLPAATTIASIGILGGVIDIGPHQLIVPAGALTGTQVITAKIVAGDSTNSVQFYPEGLRFNISARLALSYQTCSRTNLMTQLKVAYTSNDLLTIIELLPSTDVPVKKSVVGTLSHFSRYAVAF